MTKPTRAGRFARPGERFSTDVTLERDDIADFARAAGDANPIHHDEAHARGTRFGAVVASGAQTSALLMGLTASHFSRRSAMVGLEFGFRFKQPVLAGSRLRLEWLVVSARHHERLGGDVVELRGRIVTGEGGTAVGAKGKVLLTAKL